MSIPYTCVSCSKPTSADRDSMLAALKICRTCQDARVARGEAAQRKAER